MMIYDLLTLQALAANNPRAAVCTISKHGDNRWVDHAACLVSRKDHTDAIFGDNGHIVQAVQPHGPWLNAAEMRNTCEICHDGVFERWTF